MASSTLVAPTRLLDDEPQRGAEKPQFLYETAVRSSTLGNFSWFFSYQPARRRGMQSTCPHRHVSYATWRLHVLRQLFHVVDGPSSPPYQHSVAARARAQRLAPMRSQSTSRQDAHAPAESQDALKDGHSPDAGSAETQSAPVDQHTSTRKKKNKKQFNPYSDAGRASLRDALADLDTLIAPYTHSSADTSQGTSAPPPPPPPPLDSAAETSVSASPVVRRLRARRQLKQHPKLQPSSAEQAPLRHNPWAQLLASPLRQCAATGERVPSDLLTEFGPLKKPAADADGDGDGDGDQDIYLVPARLADTGALRAEIQRLERRERRRALAEQLSRAGHTPDQVSAALAADWEQVVAEHGPASVASPPRKPAPPLTRLTTSAALMAFLAPSLERSRAAVTRILPTRTKLRWAAAMQWERQRDSTGATAAQRYELSRLRWAGAMEDRLRRVLVERVLVSLRCVGESSESKTSGVRWLRLPRDLAEAETRTSPSSAPPGGSVLLGLGADMQSLQPPSVPHGVAGPTSNPLVPPLWPLGPHRRFPLFPLDELLRPRLRARAELLEILASHAVFERPPDDDDAAGDGDGDDYVLLVTPTTVAGRALVTELWQLWRYIGGRDGIQSGE